MAVAPQQLINAQNQVELGKLPLWYGDPKKDYFSAEHYIKRIQNSKDAAGWDDQTTCNYLFQALREPALKWVDAMETRGGMNPRVWNEVKHRFLKTYGTTVTERTAVANIQPKQGATETVNDFFARCSQCIVEHTLTARPFPDIPDAELANKFMANAPAGSWGDNITNATRRTMMNNLFAIRDEYKEDVLLRSVFVHGLRENIRTHIMARDGPEPALDTMDRAAKFERDMTDPNKVVTHVTEVEETDEVDAIRRRKGGQGNFKKASASPSSKSVKCYYCGVPGHIQPNCHKRQREKGQWKDKDGKPWKRRVNEMSHDEENGATLAHDIATTENALSSINFDYVGNQLNSVTYQPPNHWLNPNTSYLNFS